jgi:hypothetical protein
MTRRSTSERDSLRVLFIGNSFTARNDLPGLVARIASAAGKSLEHRLISAGGASLRMHWNKGEAQKAIQSGGYDFVVLQEQSTLPIKNAGRMRENVILFDEAIRAAGAKTALYMTWARKGQAEKQALITKAYAEIGEEIGAVVIAAGNAWREFMGEHKTPVLHDKDGSHPTLAGSYLAACVAYGSLFGDSPGQLRVKIEGLSEAEMKVLQKVAVPIVTMRAKSSARG